MEASRAITRKSASNLALAFFLLPKAKRDAMAALYAFCREVDDVSDDESQPPEQRRARLAQWRRDVQRACGGAAPALVENVVNRELQPFILQYKLPFALFDELIRGMEMDLDIHRYPTFEALEAYCYRAASVVGLLSIEIFGYQNPKCRDYAVCLGKALQLTNILRDFQNDAQRGRIYLPLSELARFHVAEEEILQGRYSERYHQLALSAAARAKEHYRLAQAALPAEDRRSMIAAGLMGTVYWRLLEKLEAARFNVFGVRPIRLSKARKLGIAAAAWLRHCSGGTAHRYAAP